MDYKKIITGLLSKAYKLDDGKVAELLQDGENITEDTVVAALLTEDSTRVASIKKSTDTTGKFQEGYAKAKKEERANYEKEIREKYGIESETAGIELIDEVVTTKVSEQGTGKKGEVTEDDVKKHPVYQTLETRYKKDLKAKDTEWETKLNEVETKYKTETTFKSIEERALSTLDGLKPVLPGNPEIATNQKRWFVSALKDYQFDIQDGNRVVVMKDGKVVEDGHGNSLDFGDLVKQKASQFFEFQKNNGGGNAGNNNQDNPPAGGGNGEYPAGIKKPATLDELAAIANDRNIPLKDRQKVIEVFEQESGSSQ